MFLEQNIWCPEVDHLAECFRPHSEVSLIAVEEPINEEITKELHKEQIIKQYLYIHPVCNETCWVGNVYLFDHDAKYVEDTNDVNT